MDHHKILQEHADGNLELFEKLEFTHFRQQ